MIQTLTHSKPQPCVYTTVKNSTTSYEESKNKFRTRTTSEVFKSRNDAAALFMSRELSILLYKKLIDSLGLSECVLDFLNFSTSLLV